MPGQKFHMKIWLVAPLVVSVIIGLVKTKHTRESKATDREAVLDVNPPPVIDDVSPTVESLISGLTGNKKFLRGGDRVWQSPSNIKDGKRHSRVSASVGDLVDGLSAAVGSVVTTVTDNIGLQPRGNRLMKSYKNSNRDERGTRVNANVGDLVDGLSTAVGSVVTTVTDNVDLQLRGSGLKQSDRNSNRGERKSRVNANVENLADGLATAVGDLVTTATDSIDLQLRGTGLMKSPLNSNYHKRETRVKANVGDLVDGLSTAVGSVVTTVTDNIGLQLRGSGLMKSDRNSIHGKRKTRVNASAGELVDGLAIAVGELVTTATDSIDLQVRGSGSMNSARNSNRG
ncbi:uncharacterized protein LOC124802959 [Schistocerca piceifrons]|uniref:uncharacterized protein LOC124802959 n=1 Tax=Schistocerca piceifrons TaxID=274613 RepID=UPI001F5F257A|nr:uncharacterized protein LOC124802959 [Schistocerca piceifrons]